MPIRPIIRFPDPRLQAKADIVTGFDAGLAQLATDVLETMRAAPGIGMTACHIGVLERLAVIELAKSDGVHIYVNPEVTWSSAETLRHIEGSVSMPGVTEEIERPAKIRVRYEDLSGAENVIEADGLLAVCLQHEIDQLNGIFWTHKLSRLKRDRLLKRFQSLTRIDASAVRAPGSQR